MYYYYYIYLNVTSNELKFTKIPWKGACCTAPGKHSSSNSDVWLWTSEVSEYPTKLNTETVYIVTM